MIYNQLFFCVNKYIFRFESNFGSKSGFLKCILRDFLDSFVFFCLLLCVYGVLYVIVFPACLLPFTKSGILEVKYANEMFPTGIWLEFLGQCFYFYKIWPGGLSQCDLKFR